ncbi:MAG: TlpA disulfide reductase family protein [Geobacteraceae bacterium]|jgi:peroxiredoxin
MRVQLPKVLKHFHAMLPGSIIPLMCLLLSLSNFLSGCADKSVPKIGETPPAISCNDVTGEYISLNRLKGNVVVIYFWSSTCCGDRLKQHEPWFSLNKYKGLSILAVNVGGDENSVRLFATNNGLTFTMLTDEHGMISRQYGVIGFPTIFIIDRNGVIRNKIVGDIETAYLFKLVSRLL